MNMVEVVFAMCMFIALMAAVVSTIATNIGTQDWPPEAFSCTQSQIIDGKAECVEYRRTEK